MSEADQHTNKPEAIIAEHREQVMSEAVSHTDEHEAIVADSHSSAARVHRLFCEAQPPKVRQLLDPDFEMPSEILLSGSDGNTSPNEPQQKFTPKQVQASPESAEWKQAEYQQLDQYEDQDMFGAPEPGPKGEHAWKLIWMYSKKGANEGYQKRARCVVDGSSRGRQHTKVGHTFANSLAYDGERTFWAIVAQRGMVVIGADVSNAFAEAKIPEDTEFYILVDDNFRDRWKNHKKRQPIPEGQLVCKVKYALQGHPKAPRLWEHHVDHILKNKLPFKPTTHERRLYSANVLDSYV